MPKGVKGKKRKGSMQGGMSGVMDTAAALMQNTAIQARTVQDGSDNMAVSGAAKRSDEKAVMRKQSERGEYL